MPVSMRIGSARGDVLDGVELAAARARRRARTRRAGWPRRRTSRPSPSRTVGLTSWRSRVWRGGSVSSIVLRASIASGASSSISVPPTSDEYVRQSLCTATSSSQRVTAQKPLPVWPLAAVSLIHATGASRAQPVVASRAERLRRRRRGRRCRRPARSRDGEPVRSCAIIARCRRGTGRACGGG